MKDAFNFKLNQEGKNGAQFEGGWTRAKYEAFSQWIDSNPGRLKMSRAEFNKLLQKAAKSGTD